MSDKYILYDPAAFGASEIREDTRDAEITRLREENARLREALKPFADAAEGTGMFYTVDIWDARVFDSEEEAKKWCKDGERPQIMLGG